MFHYSHPNAFFQPHLHPRGCSREYLLGLGCQGCSGACSTPFSRLLQPSVRGVVDLEVMTFGRHPLPYPLLCGRVTLSVGVHSVCAPVSKSGGLAGLLRSPGSIHSSDGSSASRPFLRFLLRDTVYQFQALCFGLSTAPPVFTWVMAPVSALLHSLGIRMRRYLDTWLVQSSSQESLPGSAVSVGRLRFHLFQGFSVGGTHLSAAICNRRIYVMRLDYREPVAVASRHSFFASSPSSGRLAFFLSWLASFLAATWDCSPSSSASIVPGTVRIWRLQSWRRWSVFTVSSGGSISIVSLSACLCTKCLLSFTFGQTPRTWVGAPISTVRSLRACRTPVRQRCLSTPGNC